MADWAQGQGPRSLSFAGFSFLESLAMLLSRMATCKEEETVPRLAHTAGGGEALGMPRDRTGESMSSLASVMETRKESRDGS